MKAVQYGILWLVFFQFNMVFTDGLVPIRAEYLQSRSS